MTHKRANLFSMRVVCLFLLAFMLTMTGLFALPNQALTCACYDDEDTESIVSADAACKTACGDLVATEIDPGMCECENGEVMEIGCSGVCAAENLSDMTAAQATEAYEKEGYIAPELQIEIPGLVFTKVLSKGGHLEISWLGEYIAAVYTYLIGIGTIIAIVFIMIGGLQYTIAGGHGDTGKAKARIRNAVTGLVLLISVYLILWIVNPNLTFFEAVSMIEVAERELDAATSGYEGAMFGALPRATCDEIVKKAKEKGTCDIKQTVTSPTGAQPGCSNHHWFDYGRAGDYSKITNLDFGAGWGTSVLAPFDGVVTYEKQTKASNKCGNRIYLTGSGDAAGAEITICHAKDFVNDTGAVLSGSTVTQGAVIGHIGGKCCDGESPPSAWASAKNGWCNVSGTPCSDPYSLESCDCQPVEQAGNTSGPHVHMTWKSGGHLLACLDY